MDIIQDEAYHAHQNIVKLRNRIMGDFLGLGALLYDFERNEWYRDYDHPTFNSYLADPDVDISRSVAYALKGIHEKFMLELKSPSDGLTQIGYNKLDIIRPVVDEDNVTEWLSKAEALSRSDLRKEVKEAKGEAEPEWDDDAEWAVLMSVVSDYLMGTTDHGRRSIASNFLTNARNYDAVRERRKPVLED